MEQGRRPVGWRLARLGVGRVAVVPEEEGGEGRGAGLGGDERPCVLGPWGRKCIRSLRRGL